MAQSVERVLGKDEVTGSNPVSSSIKGTQQSSFFFIKGDLRAYQGIKGLPKKICRAKIFREEEQGERKGIPTAKRKVCQKYELRRKDEVTR